MMRYTRETICRVLFGDEFAAARAEVAEAASVVFGDCAKNSCISRFGDGCPSQGAATLMELRDSAGRAMSDRQIHDEILTFFLAGHDMHGSLARVAACICMIALSFRLTEHESFALQLVAMIAVVISLMLAMIFSKPIMLRLVLA